jgi:hypothetical protein
LPCHDYSQFKLAVQPSFAIRQILTRCYAERKTFPYTSRHIHKGE